MLEDGFGKLARGRCGRMRLRGRLRLGGVFGGSAGSCTGRSFLDDFDEQEFSTQADAAAAQVAISSERRTFRRGPFLGEMQNFPARRWHGRARLEGWYREG